MHKLDERWFENQVLMAFKNTTAGERCQIAHDFCVDFSGPEELSNKVQINAMALIVAGMLEVNHPLVENYCKNVTVTTCAKDCLEAQLLKTELAIPILSPERTNVLWITHQICG